MSGAFGAKSANDELRAGLAADLEQALAALPNDGPVRSGVLGSVSAGVARTAAYPVLVVPSRVEPIAQDTA